LNVGADAHIGPFESCKFAESFCIIGTFCRTNAGIGPCSDSAFCIASKWFSIRQPPLSQTGKAAAVFCSAVPLAFFLELWYERRKQIWRDFL